MSENNEIHNNPELERVANVALGLKRSKEVSALTFVILAQSEMVDDVTITENAELFLEWDKYFRTDKRGVIVREKVKDSWVLFRNIHPIIDASQNVQPSKDTKGTMWTRIGDVGDEWPLWSQPHGAHDAYPPGAQVTHNGERWINTHIGYNSWEPGVFGWTKQQTEN